MTRVAIVTGGSRGIGEAISKRLRDCGYTVVANYAGNDARARAFTDATGTLALEVRKQVFCGERLRGGVRRG